MNKMPHFIITTFIYFELSKKNLPIAWSWMDATYARLFEVIFQHSGLSYLYHVGLTSWNRVLIRVFFFSCTCEVISPAIWFCLCVYIIFEISKCNIVNQTWCLLVEKKTQLKYMYVATNKYNNVICKQTHSYQFISL